jgi:hypothetical protein
MARIPEGSPLADATNVERKWLYRVGGISALALGIGYVVTIPIFAHVGAPPNDGEAWLTYLPGKTTEWWVILGLSVVTDLLYIPVALALYFVLETVHRAAMLIASAFVGLFIVLDLAVTWANHAALITLSDKYGAAKSDVQRQAYVAAADYASAVLASHVEAVYAIVLLSLGILVIGVVMLKGAFGKGTAYLALAIGILGIASIAGWSVTIILNALCATVWMFFVSYKLYRLSRLPLT